MKYFENRSYSFGGLATKKGVEISGAILEEYLSESSHGHTVRELWGEGILTSILLHEIEGEDLEKAEWDLVSRTLVAVMNGNCPPTEALAIQGFVVELVADVYEYYSNLDEYDNAYGHYYLFNSYEETIDWAVCELAHICQLELQVKLENTERTVIYDDGCYEVELIANTNNTHMNQLVFEPVAWTSNRNRDARMVLVPHGTTQINLNRIGEIIGGQR